MAKDPYIFIVYEGTRSLCPLSGSAHDLALVACNRGLEFGLRLHREPVFVYASNKGFGESVQLSRVACVFVSRICNSLQNLMNWLIYTK